MLLAPDQVPPLPSIGDNSPTPAELVMAEQRMLIYLAERSGKKSTKQQPPQQQHKRGSASEKTVRRDSTASGRRDGDAPEDDQAQAAADEAYAEVQKMHEALHETLHEMWESPRKLSAATPLADSIALDVALTPVSEEAALATLRKVRAWRHLSSDELQAVLQASSRRLLPRYTHAVREGGTCECCFVVLAGSLEVYRSQPERNELRRQQRPRLQPDGSIVRPPSTSAVGSVGGVAVVSDMLGEDGLIMPNPRERTLITLEPVELLAISPAALEQLRRPDFCARYRIQGAAAVAKLRRGVESLYIERGLQHVPFFTTLPRLTQEQLSGLFTVRFVAQGEMCAEQGEPASALFVLLTGVIELWRRSTQRSPARSAGGAKRRGSPAPERYGECREGSGTPWFGEALLFNSTGGLAHEADAIAAAPTILLALPLAHIDRFVQLAPGFKAMCLSGAVMGGSVGGAAGSAVAGARSGEGASSGSADDPPAGDEPSASLADGGATAPSVQATGAAAPPSSDAAAHAELHWPMHWPGGDEDVPVVSDWAAQLEQPDAMVREEPPDNLPPPSEQEQWRAEEEARRRRAYMLARQKHFGDSRTLAAKASGKPWRTTWTFAQQLRAEQLASYQRPRQQPSGQTGAGEGADTGQDAEDEDEGEAAVVPRGRVGEEAKRFMSMREPTPPWVPPHQRAEGLVGLSGVMTSVERESLMELPPRATGLQPTEVVALSHARSEPGLVAHRDVPR